MSSMTFCGNWFMNELGIIPNVPLLAHHLTGPKHSNNHIVEKAYNKSIMMSVLEKYTECIQAIVLFFNI
jgi:hypothetical protein